MLAIAAHRRRFRAGLGLGTISGLCLLIPLLSWAGGYVGSVWLILPCAFSIYFGVMGGLSALASPVVDRWRWTWPLMAGSMWVLQEALRDRTPFGGFPWGRLAFSQGDSPLLHLAMIGGAPLVTFGVAALGGLLAATAHSAGSPYVISPQVSRVGAALPGHRESPRSLRPLSRWCLSGHH